MQIIRPKIKDLGNFEVRRILPSAKVNMVGPWVFFDHIGPAQCRAGKGLEIRPHPHIGLGTVTNLYEGELLHRDSLGNEQIIKPGEVNLMIAGKGITHSERGTEYTKSMPHSFHSLQLWHALPVELEEMEPAFYHYPKEQIPQFVIDNVTIRLLMGKAFNHESPVKTHSETLYLDITMPAGTKFEAPIVPELAVYAVKGEIMINDETIAPYHMVTLTTNQVNEISANSDAQIVLIGGEPLGYRYIDWNFVASRKELIVMAKRNWRNFQFPKVVGDEKEFIPLPRKPKADKKPRKASK